MYLSAARHVALCSSDLQRDMLPLTCLYVCDHSRVVKWAGEEVSPTGAPTGITHGSRMAGVNSQASPTLRSIPHLPDTGTSHPAKVTNSPRLQQQRNFYSLCTILEESFHSSTAWNTLQLTRNCQIQITRLYQQCVRGLWLITSLIHKRKNKREKKSYSANRLKVVGDPCTCSNKRQMKWVWQQISTDTLCFKQTEERTCVLWMRFQGTLLRIE